MDSSSCSSQPDGLWGYTWHTWRLGPGEEMGRFYQWHLDTALSSAAGVASGPWRHQVVPGHGAEGISMRSPGAEMPRWAFSSPQGSCELLPWQPGSSLQSLPCSRSHGQGETIYKGPAQQVPAQPGLRALFQGSWMGTSARVPALPFVPQLQ